MQRLTFCLTLLGLSGLYSFKKAATEYMNNAPRTTTNNLTSLPTKPISSFAESPLESFVDTFCLPSNTSLTSSVACKSLSRYRNVLTPVSQVEAPPLQVKVHYLNYCSPSNPVCDKMKEEIRSMVPKSLRDIHQWLYTSPVYSFLNGPNKPTQPRPLFTPKYPNTPHIIFHVGENGYLDKQRPDIAAYTVFTNLETQNAVDIYFSPSTFEGITKRRTKYSMLRILRSTLTHEMVHALQNGIRDMSLGYKILKKAGIMCHAPAPRGLLEGIADYVPLMAGEPMPEYGPRPSRSSERADNWDAGYMATAYFLEWIDRVGVGSGAIGLLNAQIGKIGYHRDGEDRSFLCGRKQPDTWRAIYGRSVDDLWEAYGLYLDGETDLDPVNPPIGTTGASWDERSIGLLSTIILVTIPVALEFVGYFNWG